MNINIYINQKKIKPLYMRGIEEYRKRLSPFCRLTLICQTGKMHPSAGKCAKNFSIYAGSAHNLAPTGGRAPALSVSSEGLADMINKLALSGISELNFYIGTEPAGAVCLDICTVSASYDMYALLLSEQLYRACTILNHMTYHK